MKKWLIIIVGTGVVVYSLKSKVGKALVESNSVLNNNSRIIEYNNGSKIRNTELTTFANIIWLAP